MVAKLISENRTLRRQVAKLATKSKAPETKKVDGRLRAISRKVERALSGTKTRRLRAASSNGRRKKATTRRRKAS